MSKPKSYGSDKIRYSSAFDSYPVGAKPKQYKGSQKKLELRDQPQGAPAARTIEAKTPTDSDPYGSHYFALEITGEDGSVEVAHFLEFSGIKNSCTTYDIIEGGHSWNVHKRVGRSKWENLTLKYATSTSTFMMRWRSAYLSGNFEKRKLYSGSVALMSNQGKVLRRFHFVNAWPVSWEGPAMASGGSDLAIETLVLAHDGISVDEAALGDLTLA
jgi:phage tail-like protein